ncbi:MAG: Rossmann-like domain-containing protein [Thermodesulfobacteriota bacterium]
MKILADLLSSLRGNHFPVKSVHACVFWTAVVSKHCGLSSTFRDEAPPHDRGVRDVGNLTQKTALELAEYARSTSLLEASIGMATINSLIDIEESVCVEKNAFEIILERGQGKNVAIVGHFPWIPKLKGKTKNLWVLEQRIREGDLPAKEADRILPQCDVVGITGTSFINHTLEGLLSLCKEAYVLLIGPTSPLSPLLFDYGIDAICGSKVIDPDQLIRSISEGATFKEVKGVKLLTLKKKD